MELVLPYRLETWQLSLDMRIPLMFEYRCLRSVGEIKCENFFSTLGPLSRVLGPRFGSLEEALNTNR